jgi:hypothetical protein
METTEVTVREVPASVGQRVLWLMNRHRGGGPALNERLVWRVRGPIDPGAMQFALDALAERHEALRTTFAGRGRGLIQRVGRAAAVEFDHVRVDGAGDGLERAIAAEAERELDLDRSPLRGALISSGPRDHVLFLSIHHLVTDHSSNALVAADLATLYEQATQGGPPPPPVNWQYADFSEWQRGQFESGRQAELQAFWAMDLEGAAFARLPWREPATGLSERAYERRRLDAEVARALTRLADATGTSRFAVALAAFLAELFALTGQRDIAVASLYANRPRPEVARTVGFFVNLLVLRGVVDPDAGWLEFVRRTGDRVSRAAAHQDLPFHMLPPRALSGRADDVVFQYIEGEPRPAAHARLTTAELTPLEREWRRSRFALELFVAYDRTGVVPILVYDTGRVDAELARRLADGYVTVLGAIAGGETRSVGALGDLLAPSAA